MNQTASRAAESGAGGPDRFWLHVLVGYGIFIALQAAILLIDAGAETFGSFEGPDDYMRLTRTMECLGGIACDGHLLLRSNAPYGEVLHWPFLLDRLLLVLAAPFIPFLGLRSSVILAGHLLGPLLALGSIVLLSLGARALLSRGAWPLAPPLLGATLWFLLAMSPRRADHHGLQTALLVGTVAFTLRLIAGRGDPMLQARLIGLFLALGLWVSVEGMIASAPVLAVLAVLWLVSGRTDVALWQRRLAMTTAAVLLVALLVDPPASGLLSIELDRFSLIHLLIFVLLTAFWWTMEHVGSRSIGLRSVQAFLGLLTVAAAALLASPRFFQGPMAEVHPDLFTFWLNNMVEFVPLLESGSRTHLLMSLLPLAMALPAAGLGAARRRGGGRIGWLLVLVTLIWFACLSFFLQVRWSYYLHALLPLPWAAGIAALSRRSSRGLIRAGLVTAGLLLYVLIPTAALAVGGGSGRYARAGEVPGICDAREASRVLDEMAPTIVLAPSYWGPEILFRTHHSVVATPYHRNEEGLLSSRAVMATSPARAGEMLRSRGGGVIAFCRGQPWSPSVDSEASSSLYAALQSDERPDWIETEHRSGSLVVVEIER